MSSQKGKRKDDSDANGPKRPMQRRVINRLSELDIPESFAILPEYQSEGVLDDLLEEFTYESMIEAAYYRPLFRQRFFGILDPLTKKDDIDESFVVADQLLVPQAFQVLLRKDFGIAAKPEDCSAKTFAFRKLVADSLKRYAPSFNSTEGVSRLDQLTRFRELYIWLRSFGSKNPAIYGDRNAVNIFLIGDGVAWFNEDVYKAHSDVYYVSIVDLFQWVVGRIDKKKLIELRGPNLGPAGLDDVVIKKDRNTSVVFLNFTSGQFTFHREKDAYFPEYIKSGYMGYKEPLGLFRYDKEKKEAEIVMVLNRQLVGKIGSYSTRFFPGYCLLIGPRGFYTISENPTMRSHAVETVSYLALEDYALRYNLTKYIDDNGNISPRVMFTFSSDAGCVFVVADFPLTKEPIIRQYPYVGLLVTEARVTQTNFLWVNTANRRDINSPPTATIFDPTTGKVVKFKSNVAVRLNNIEPDDSDAIDSSIPPIAFNFQNKESLFYGEPIQLVEEKVLHEKDLVVKRDGKFVFDVNVGPRLLDIDEEEEESEGFVPYDSDNDQ